LTTTYPRHHAHWILLAALALTRLALTYGQPIQAVFALHDDLLFLRQAQWLSRGDWLGAYDQLTLAKGPGYPLWIAGVNFTGLSLKLCEHLLFILACLATRTAVRPLFGRRVWAADLMYALLLFIPSAFGITRVVRANLYGPLELFLLAGLIGLYTRRDQQLRPLLGWSLMAGVALPWLWLTREEGVASAPMAILPFVASWLVWKARPKDIAARLFLFVLPAILLAASLFGVSSMNEAKYGVFCTVEFKHHSFEAAVGALQCVEHAERKQYILVPKETRMQIYAASPAFRELESDLEGVIGTAWHGNAVSEMGWDVGEGQIAGSWFLWALRDAVARAGHGKNGNDAALFYDRIASEIELASRSGELRCESQRASVAPPWRSEYAAPLIASVFRLGWRALRFQGLSVESTQPSEQRAVNIYPLIIRDRLTPVPGARASESWLWGPRAALLDAILFTYGIVAPMIVPLGLLFYFFNLFSFFKFFKFANPLGATGRHSRTRLGDWSGWKDERMLFQTVVLAYVMVRFVLLAYIDVSSFPAQAARNLALVQPLLILFAMLSLAQVSAQQPGAGQAEDPGDDEKRPPGKSLR
jgi:hypothetical protein